METLEGLYIRSKRLVDQVNTDHLRYLYNKIDWSARMISIKGARGVGKTTMILQRMKLAHRGDGALYVHLDDLWFQEHRLMELAEYHYLHGGTHLFIDEVHRYPQNDWITELKDIYDDYPSLHIVFSGSSLLHIEHSKGDLSRRCLFYELAGLSFREYLSFENLAEFNTLGLSDILENHLENASIVNQQIKVIPAFENYLRNGYYPIYKEGLLSYNMRLEQVVNNVLENDLPYAEKIELATIQKMKRLMSIISRMVPYTPNISSLASAINATRPTVEKMLYVLDKASIMKILYSGKNNMSQLGRPEKIYFNNPNLMYAFTDSPKSGTIRETFFANQLSNVHSLSYSKNGDFMVDDKLVFEIGGDYKTFSQIKDMPNSYLAIDGIDYGHGNRIPLWLFGFLY